MFVLAHPYFMKKTLLILSLFSVLVHAETKPLKALLIAGGCCHDYAKQHEILSKGIQARAKCAGGRDLDR